MTLTTHTLLDLEQARRRNAARLKGQPEEFRVPDDPDRIEQWMPIRYIKLGRAQLVRLLIFGELTLSKSNPGLGLKGHTCPWGNPGDYRWIHEPVILHPRLGPVFSNDPNWMEFARKHQQEKKMPIQLRRLFVRVARVKRIEIRWQLTVYHALSLPRPGCAPIGSNRESP